MRQGEAQKLSPALDWPHSSTCWIALVMSCHAIAIVDVGPVLAYVACYVVM